MKKPTLTLPARTKRNTRSGARWFAAASAALLMTVSALAQTPANPAQKVNGSYMRANEKQTLDWPSYGLDYAETRFSKLKQINTNTVKDLGLVWSYNLESTRGVEATPLVVGGVMYVTAAWSVVHAVDVRTGKRL